MSSPEADSPDEIATLDPAERALLEKRIADLDDEGELLTVGELRSRFE